MHIYWTLFEHRNILHCYYLGSAVRRKKEEEQVVNEDNKDEDEEKAYKVIGFLFGRYKFKLNVENVKLPHTKMVCV